MSFIYTNICCCFLISQLTKNCLWNYSCISYFCLFMCLFSLFHQVVDYILSSLALVSVFITPLCCFRSLRSASPTPASCCSRSWWPWASCPGWWWCEVGVHGAWSLQHNTTGATLMGLWNTVVKLQHLSFHTAVSSAGSWTTVKLAC